MTGVYRVTITKIEDGPPSKLQAVIGGAVVIGMIVVLIIRR
jgi:hypothetical protein